MYDALRRKFVLRLRADFFVAEAEDAANASAVAWRPRLGVEAAATADEDDDRRLVVGGLANEDAAFSAPAAFASSKTPPAVSEAPRPWRAA